LTEALQYFLPKYWIKKEYSHYKTAIYFTLLVQLLFGSALALLMYWGADWLAIHHFKSPQAASVLKTLCWYFV
jgi:Na+-driven multidrug efflux pump